MSNIDMNESGPDFLASEIDLAIRTLRVQNTPSIRSIRRRFSRKLENADAQFVLGVASALLKKHGHRWVAYELIAAHEEAYRRVGEKDLEKFGAGINSWWTVDAYARILSGPAWLKGQVRDGLILRWARSKDLWWRRAALVSTVALNIRSDGGCGDTVRTLRISRILVKDREDMVVKALSWALRALAVPCPDAVRRFLRKHDAQLAARVKREVRNKLTTGLKNPRR